MLQVQKEALNALNNSRKSTYLSTNNAIAKISDAAAILDSESSLNLSNNININNNNKIKLKNSLKSKSNPPDVDLNPRAKSVTDLLEEWYNGYKGQPSLNSLEKHWGTKWRRGRIAKSAQRRKKVVEFCIAESKKNPTYTKEKVAELLDEYRHKLGKGLFWLYGNVPKKILDGRASN
ncbi:unnamed protein product [[Candida] boidinii]|nr:unnamed protein product [[Candida] boidinii]